MASTHSAPNTRFHTPNQGPSRPTTPSPRRRMERDLDHRRAEQRRDSARARARTRSADDEYNGNIGLGTRVIALETQLRSQTDRLVKQDNILHQADELVTQLQTRIAAAERP